MFGLLDVLRSKNATKSFNKSFCEFNIFSFSSHLVKYVFSFYVCKLIFLPILKTIFKFCCRRLLFLFKQNIDVKPYTSMQISCCCQGKTMVPDNFKRNLYHFNKKEAEHVMFRLSILNWKRIKPSFFEKYMIILIWSF